MDEWMNDIVFQNEEDKKELIFWGNTIGYQRYYDLYYLIKEYKQDAISYELLKEVAQYDFHLSDQLHSMLKFFELRIRAFLCNKYGQVALTKEKYLYEIADALTNGKNRLPCDTYYEKKLKASCTLAEFLNASSMETLLKVFLAADDKELSAFGTGKNLSETCFFVKELRNLVAHGKVLAGASVRSKGKEKSVKELYNTLLSFMPTETMRTKRSEYIQGLNSRFLVNESKEFREKIIVEPCV